MLKAGRVAARVCRNVNASRPAVSGARSRSSRQLSRMFGTASKPQEAALKNTQPATAAASSAAAASSGDMNFLQPYGYAAVGLGLTGLLAKEVLVFGEEMLVGMCFGGFTMVAYTLGSEQMYQGLAKKQSEYKEAVVADMDALIVQLKDSIEEIEEEKILASANEAILEDIHASGLRALDADYNETVSKLTTATNDVLNSVAAFERQGDESARRHLIAAAHAHVRTTVANMSAEEKSALLDESIAKLEGAENVKDSVAAIYQKFFDDAEAKYAEMVDTSRPLTPEEKEAAKARLEATAKRLGVPASEAPAVPAEATYM